MTTEERNAAEDHAEKISKWDDPDIPAGDSPPLPSWPTWVSGALWGGWICFLLVVVMSG